MTNHEKFLAGHVFKVKGCHIPFEAKKGASYDYIIIEHFGENGSKHYANIEAISIHKCTAISLFFNDIVRQVLVFDELFFTGQKGGNDVEL